MSNNATLEKPTQTNGTSQSDLAAQADKTAKAAKAKIEAQLQSEVEAVNKAFAAYQQALQAIGPLVRQRLAIAVGRTVTKAGRPALTEWSRFVHSLVYSKVSFTEQDSLFKLASANVGKSEDATAKEWTAEEVNKARERFVKAKAKSATGSATCSLRMAAPVAIEIQLGD